MEAGNRGDKAEPQTVAGAAPTVVEPVEPLQNVLVLFGWNARAMVGDRNHRTQAIGGGLDQHIARAAMLDGVVDEIGDGIEEEIPIAQHWRLPLTYDFNANAFLLGGSIEQL